MREPVGETPCFIQQGLEKVAAFLVGLARETDRTHVVGPCLKVSLLRFGRSISGPRHHHLRGTEDLRHALVVEDVRKIDRWTARYRLSTVTWPTEPLDPFFNANTMDDIAEAERLAALDEN
jgi:hypothetical protein